jgi:hypothetical protein
MAHREFEDEAMSAVKTLRPSTQLEVPGQAHATGRVPHYTLIGRKLESIYDIPSDPSDAIEALLRDLDKKMDR